MVLRTATCNILRVVNMWNSLPNSVVHDVDKDVRRRSRRAQAKASMPASYRHFTINYFTESHILLLRLPVPLICALKLYITSSFCQNLSTRNLNVLVVLADTTQFGKLFHVLTTLSAKLYLRKSYLT